ncbi:MAG: hypothetical protein H6Q90_6778, partial [Deltaproteobacteria bacterium]|nr:hypothetical protein [Deltaproteobacteria bacterium]
MSFRSCRRPGWVWAVAVACGLALATVPAVAGPARVTPSDLDGPGGPSKTLARTPVIAAGTDIKNLTTLATFATIQAAIDDPGTLAGHVLEVQVPTHAESIVTVHKSVTIQGGGGGGGAIITPLANTGSSGDARAWFLVTASGVTFQNLTFDGTGKAIFQVLRFNAPGGFVDSCAFLHIRYSQYLGMGIVSYHNLTIDDCDFNDIERLGIILFGSGVTTSTVGGCTYTGKGDGDWIDYGVELGGGAIASLSNNTISNCTGVALSDGSNSAGVLITDYYGPGTTGTLGNNFITGNTIGVAIGYLATDMSVVVAFENDLSGNDFGTSTTNVAHVADCSANWWGSIDPATVAASAGGGIDYTPWLHVGTDTNATAGFQGDFSALHVDDSSPQIGALLRITEAIGLVSGSTVYLAPGTYPGNVIVNKKLTLQGSGDGTDPAVASILLPPAGTIGIEIQVGGTGAADRCQIRDLRVSGGTYGLRINNVLGYLTLQNLTVTGASVYGFEIHNTADLTDLVMTDVDLVSNASMGMRVRGKLDGLTMTNGHVDGNVHGLQSVTGVGEGNNFLNVVITGTTFDNNTSKGMYLEKLSDAVFDGISVVNSGTAGSWAAGIDINLKYAAYQDIEIRNSTISGCGTGDPVNGVGITVKARTDGSTYGANPATLTNVDLLANTITGCQNGIRFGEPGKNNPGPTVVDVHENQITSSVGMGLDNASLTTTNASCNWWGSALGPNVPPGNPSPGDGISGSATFAAWWTTATGPCDGWGANNIAAIPDTCISTVHPCETVDMLFTRADPTPMRGYSVSFHLSPELMLCGTPTASILAGPYLASGSGANGTVYQVVDNGGGSYTVDEAILGTPCGATGSGVLFRVRVTNSGAN